MESNALQTSQGKAVVAVFAAVLERLVHSNSHVSSMENVTKFHALKAPAISIKHYLERIHKYASCSTECYILALIYIDRLIQRNNFVLTELNVHRVCITAVLLAAKFFDDAYYNNAYYAKVGGVLVTEMNGLEVEFLFRINFSLHVTPELFLKYQDELISHAIGAGLERPIEMAASSCVHPVTPPSDAPSQVQVPMPVTAPFPLQCPSMEHVYYSNGSVNTCIPNECAGNTNTTVPYQQYPGMRHITPSPPEHHNHDPNKISPAHSEPGGMKGNGSNLSSNTMGNLTHDTEITRNTRPRYNSYPVESYNTVNRQLTLHQEQIFYPTATLCHYPTKARIRNSVEVFPCSHFERQMDSSSNSPHLVNAPRGVYQQ